MMAWVGPAFAQGYGPAGRPSPSWYGAAGQTSPFICVYLRFIFQSSVFGFTGLGSFFHPTGVQTQEIGPDLLVKLKFTFGFVW
jgi:hypothetical protein